MSTKNQGQGVAPQALPRDRDSIREFISMAAHDLREPCAPFVWAPAYWGPTTTSAPRRTPRKARVTFSMGLNAWKH